MRKCLCVRAYVRALVYTERACKPESTHNPSCSANHALHSHQPRRCRARARGVDIHGVISQNEIIGQIYQKALVGRDGERSANYSIL